MSYSMWTKHDVLEVEGHGVIGVQGFSAVLRCNYIYAIMHGAFSTRNLKHMTC